MTRIIAGTARGRSLDVPKTGTRPTSDRVREAIFSSLGHRLGNWVNVQVLDLYAGSAAFSFEALSRGASTATAIEKDRHACDVIRKNSMHLQLPLTVVCDDVSRALLRASSHAYDLVFLDPPYEMQSDALSANLELLVSNGYVGPDSIVVIERSRRSEELNLPEVLSVADDRLHGETRVITAVW
ncbi:MAG: hypothetical protein RIS75_460 [Actinomycetota bacterium]|jgi:16S rRNA (guanine966-N2)-methyltransferase